MSARLCPAQGGFRVGAGWVARPVCVGCVGGDTSPTLSSERRALLATTGPAPRGPHREAGPHAT